MEIVTGELAKAKIIRQISGQGYLVKCLWCDKEFVTYKSKLSTGRGKFCSKRCSSKASSEGFR